MAETFHDSALLLESEVARLVRVADHAKTINQDTEMALGFLRAAVDSLFREINQLEIGAYDAE